MHIIVDGDIRCHIQYTSKWRLVFVRVWMFNRNIDSTCGQDRNIDSTCGQDRNIDSRAGQTDSKAQNFSLRKSSCNIDILRSISCLYREAEIKCLGIDPSHIDTNVKRLGPRNCF